MTSLKALAAGAALLICGSTANAADLLTQATGLKDGPATNNSWAGTYAGVNFGYGWDANTGLSAAWQDTTAGQTHVLSNLSSGVAPEGWFGGGQIGYNFQTPGSSFVWGVEADIDASNLSASGTINGTYTNPAVTGPNQAVTLAGSGTYTITPAVGPSTNGTFGGSSSSTVNVAPGATLNYTTSGTKSTIDYFGTARLRGGFLLGSSVLAYGTGGLAYGGFSQRSTSAQWSASGDNVQIGWTVGAGVETKLSDHWSVKGEYLFLDFPSVDFGQGAKQDYNVSTVRAGLNYKF